MALVLGKSKTSQKAMQTIGVKPKITPSTKISCHHCGEDCPDKEIALEEKYFCCTGCKTVYEILNQNDLCKYYDLDEQAGISLKGQPKAAFAYLDDRNVQERLLNFTNGITSKITLYLPQIHCASCIWLLENLYKLNDGITASRVNFLKKELNLTYDEQKTSLRQIVELLASIGYTPAINLGDLENEEQPVIERKFYYKLGVAGFAFGNIMLLSFPEYLGLDAASEQFFSRFFGFLNVGLALPLVFFSGFDYLRSAWVGIKNGTLNIDVPISLGILTLFGRSAFEIITHTGAGYLDSLAGLVFFLLIGKWFQQRTYHHISFERDYKSYFPISAHLKKNGEITTIALDQLQPGDTILVKHQELIPADGLLLKGKAEIDYSFVTGESEPVSCGEGEKLFAGGRQTGGMIEVSITKKVSQSYLTQLWNDEAFSKKANSATVELADKVGKIFTIVILVIAFSTLAYWLRFDPDIAINAFTAVLIIACPCAVALAIPFIFGNALRILGKHKFYLKNTSVIEKITQSSTTIFDKTGTLTNRLSGNITFKGLPLSLQEKELVYELTRSSTHPISQRIAKYIFTQLPQDDDKIQLHNWEEVTGRGVRATLNDKEIKLGSYKFLSPALQEQVTERGNIYLEKNGRIRGAFQLSNDLRNNAQSILSFFNQIGDIYLLSGDHDHTQQQFLPLFNNEESHLKYRQNPKDKLNFVKAKQATGEKIMMLGDGLNDAGALQQSDVGIVISENTNNFTPACDAILDAQQFEHLPSFITFTHQSVRLVYWAYAFALVYNIIGLSFAVQGALSPIVAAILMPLSSISIVLFGTIGSNWLGRKLGKEKMGEF